MSLQATELPYFCQDYLEDLPILRGGRIKPLLVHARETLHFLSGKTSSKGYTATQTFCLLSLFNPREIELHTSIKHGSLLELLELSPQGDEISYTKLLLYREKMQETYRTLTKRSSYRRSLGLLLKKISIYIDLIDGTNWLVPVFKPQLKWIPVVDFVTKENIKSSTFEGTLRFSKLFKNAITSYQKKENMKYLLEVYYTKSYFIFWTLLVILMGLASCLFKNHKKYSLTLASIAVILQTIVITLRVIISERAPVTNMYETVLFSGYGSLVLALFIGHIKKEISFIFIGLSYNLCTLLMLLFAGGMLSSSIGPLVPVLRDNIWLSTHVTTVTLSYAAFALSWVIANTALLQKIFGYLNRRKQVLYCEMIYTCLKFGTVLLAAGLILGGVWADYSWGRFWGWDPKETWSLIVLCIYIAILHGKYTSWISSKHFIELSALAFMSVMMAWFGVNYILASGLHSYGFSEGGSLFLGSLFIVQIIISSIAMKKS